jgi:hypothetical protein
MPSTQSKPDRKRIESDTKIAFKNSAQRATKRVLQVIRWLGEGKMYSEIDALGAITFGISTRQMQKYIALARKEMFRQYQDAVPGLIEEVDTTLRLIQDSTIKSEPNIARQAVMDRAKLSGLLRERIEIDDLKAPDLSKLPFDKVRLKLRANGMNEEKIIEQPDKQITG